MYEDLKHVIIPKPAPIGDLMFDINDPECFTQNNCTNNSSAEIGQMDRNDHILPKPSVLAAILCSTHLSAVMALLCREKFWLNVYCTYMESYCVIQNG